MKKQISSIKKTSLFSQLIKTHPELISYLKEGDLVTAKLIKKLPKAAYFDLGRFGTGIIYGIELLNAKDILKDLKSGDEIKAKVIGWGNKEGYIELSLASAYLQSKWEKLKELMEKGESFNVKIKGANSGGLIAEIDEIKAFLPVSQLSSQHYPKVETGDKKEILEELRKLINQELKVKIIDLSPRSKKLIISEKEAIEEDIKELIKKYKVGDLVDGVVSGITNFGVFVKFVDNPSIEGLIHLSELTYRLIDSPKEVVSLNQTIKAKIIEIKDSQILLSLKALKPDPWEKIEEKIKEREIVKGIVYKFNPLGAVINLKDDLFGFVHVSEFGGTEEMKNVLEINKEYDFYVKLIDPQKRRIILQFKK